MSRETIVPAIPDIRDDNAKDVLSAIKSTLDVREGRIGDPLDQLVTLRDLKDLSIVTGGGNTTLTSGIKIPVVGPGIGSDGYDPSTDYTTPPTPSGLVVSSGMTSIYLSWNGAGYRNHAYAEIWRSSTNSLGSAVRIGTTIASVYADPVGRTSQTYYYWIRFVSIADVVGPYNATAGTVGGTGLVGGADLSPLIITADKIASGAIDLGGTKITGLLANANMAVITDPTKIADSLIGNTKLANLAVDAAKLADSSVTATKIANLAVGTAAIQTGAITTALIANAAIGSAQIADAAITSAKIGNLAVGNAAIQNGAITNAKIYDLAADKITAGTLTAAISVSTGLLYGGVNPVGWGVGTPYFGTGFLLGSYQGGYQFFVGTPDKNLSWNGTDLTVKGVVYASAGSFTGSIYASSGNIGGLTLDSNGLHIGTGSILGGTMTDNWYTTDLVPGLYIGSQGLRIGNGYTGKYFSVDQNGNVYAPQFTISNGNATFSGNLNAASGTFSGTLSANVTTYAQGSSWLFGFSATNQTTRVLAGGMVATSSFTIPCTQGKKYVLTASNPKWLYELGWGILTAVQSDIGGTGILTISVSGFYEGEQALCLVSLPFTSVYNIYNKYGAFGSLYSDSDLLGGVRGFNMDESAIIRHFCSGTAMGSTLTVTWYLTMNSDGQALNLRQQWLGGKFNHVTTNDVDTWKIPAGRGTALSGYDYFGMTVDIFSTQYA